MAKAKAPKKPRKARVVFEPPPIVFPDPMPPAPHEPALEAAIRADPSSDGAVAVYADWLQGQGNRLGELMIARQAVEPPAPRRKRGAKPVLTDAQQALGELEHACGLPQADFARYGWRAGIWQWLHIGNGIDASTATVDLLAIIDSLYASPLACALAELRLGMLQWDDNHLLVPKTIELAARHPWAASLDRLYLGAIEENIDMAHHCVGAIGAATSASFPNLTHLRVDSGEKAWHAEHTFELGGLALPRLQTLVIETCAMTSERVAEVLTAKLPALENLELWFGSPERDATATTADLEPLLAGRAHPNVKRLGLRNTVLADELVTRLGTIARRLVELDVSMGTLSDAGAAALVERRAELSALRTLVVDDNFLTAPAVAALRRAYDGVEVVSAAQKITEMDGDQEYRYVTVSE